MIFFFTCPILIFFLFSFPCIHLAKYYMHTDMATRPCRTWHYWLLQPLTPSNSLGTLLTQKGAQLVCVTWESSPAETMSKGHTSESRKRLRGRRRCPSLTKDLSEGTWMGVTKWPLEPEGHGQGPPFAQSKDEWIQFQVTSHVKSLCAIPETLVTPPTPNTHIQNAPETTSEFILGKAIQTMY